MVMVVRCVHNTTRVYLDSCVHFNVLLLNDEPANSSKKVDVHLGLSSVVEDSSNIDSVEEDEANERENKKNNLSCVVETERRGGGG